MKKSILSSLLFIILLSFSFAKTIDANYAKIVAQNFLENETKIADASHLTLVKTEFSKHKPAYFNAPLPLFYTFTTANNEFVIVAADDAAMPILGYSDESRTIDVNNIPNSIQKWFELYKKQIIYITDNNIEATPTIDFLWTSYYNDIPIAQAKGTNAVSPLVQTTWNQSPYYNAQCPGGSVTGCVATAMCQIMKYWDYPATGSGFHSYNEDNYGTLSANFGSTTYNWASMPNNVSSSNSAVATLMYHVGVSVDMDYSPQVSGAFVISAQSPVQHCSEYALKTYFGYKTSMQGLARSNYSESQWTSMLRTELDAGRPILYTGFGSGGGHAFVCDGYDNNGYFHFNWGWGGAYDGYFVVNALNPSGVGTGGGSGGYNSGQQALIGIEPANGGGGGGGGGTQPGSTNLALNDYVSPSNSTIYYGQSFSISTNVVNNDVNNFAGDYCAAVFDLDGNFLDYVEVLTGATLQSGYTYSSNMVFSSGGLLSMVPGSYYVGIFYRPTGNNWIEVADNTPYANFIQMNVINPNDLELTENITSNTGSSIVQGSPLSVNLNLINNSASTFYGDYAVNLYNLDGSYAEGIETITENNGLPPGYTYNNSLTFSTNAITSEPGTYLLAAVYFPNGGNLNIVGSTNYINPIRVTIKAPQISPDIYENNDAESQAYAFNPNFSGNNANVSTTGSNLHTTSDNDYYKLVLPAGSNYNVSARLHDSYNSGNGNTYSVDALFSYSTDLVNWSSAFDDVIGYTIGITNGGELYFRVAPYFAGETGSYLLQMNVEKTNNPVGIIETAEQNLVNLYPNPASERITLSSESSVEQLKLYNNLGKEIQVSYSDINSNKKQIDISNLSTGVYILKGKTNGKTFTEKLIKE